MPNLPFNGRDRLDENEDFLSEDEQRDLERLVALYNTDSELTLFSVFDDEPFDDGDYFQNLVEQNRR